MRGGLATALFVLAALLALGGAGWATFASPLAVDCLSLCQNETYERAVIVFVRCISWTSAALASLVALRAARSTIRPGLAWSATWLLTVAAASKYIVPFTVVGGMPWAPLATAAVVSVVASDSLPSRRSARVRGVIGLVLILPVSWYAALPIVWGIMAIL